MYLRLSCYLHQAKRGRKRRKTVDLFLRKDTDGETTEEGGGGESDDVLIHQVLGLPEVAFSLDGRFCVIVCVCVPRTCCFCTRRPRERLPRSLEAMMLVLGRR